MYIEFLIHFCCHISVFMSRKTSLPGPGLDSGYHDTDQSRIVTRITIIAIISIVTSKLIHCIAPIKPCQSPPLISHCQLKDIPKIN